MTTLGEFVPWFECFDCREARDFVRDFSSYKKKRGKYALPMKKLMSAEYLGWLKVGGNQVSIFPYLSDDHVEDMLKQIFGPRNSQDSKRIFRGISMK